MTTQDLEQAKQYYRLNVSPEGEYSFIPVVYQDTVNTDTTGNPPESDKTDYKLVFEDFPGKPVHLYALRDKAGVLVKNFTYNDAEGKTKTITANAQELICVLDFRNTTGDAISKWRVNFLSPGLSLKHDDLVNATLSMNGDRFYLNSVEANSKIAVGETLSHKIIFKSSGSEVPIAHDFKVESGNLDFDTDVNVSVPRSDGNWDYNEYVAAFKLLPQFFEANESGKRSPLNRVKWRYADAFMQDGADVGKDLTGGHFDAGDHLLTAHGEGYCFSNVGFTMHFYKDVFEKTGQWKYYLNSLKHATDWLLKITEVKDGKLNRLYHWIPFSKNTHNEWEIPEKSAHTRNTYIIDWNNPGSEPVHNAGACLAWAYQIFKDSDKSYAEKCLEYSKILWEFGVARPGRYKSQTVYASSSGYQDERVHHGVSLFAVTSDRKYLNDANNTWNSHIGQTYGWFNHLDNSSYISVFLLAKYDGNEKYHRNVFGLFDAWGNGKNGVKTIDGKLRALNDWATCSQGSGMGGLFALYSHHINKNQSMEDFNRSQVNYCLGDNRDNYSYVIGFGDKWLRSPHHRGSSGGIKMHEPGMNKHPLIGALIGGKKLNGYFPQDGSQSRSDWVSGEVALNYQCNIILAMAGAIKSTM